MTRLQFGLKNCVFCMTFAASATAINLKLSTSPSATFNKQTREEQTLQHRDAYSNIDEYNEEVLGYNLYPWLKEAISTCFLHMGREVRAF